MIADIVFIIIKVSTFLGCMSFGLSIVAPYVGKPQLTNTFLEHTKGYLFYSLFFIIVHILITKL